MIPPQRTMGLLSVLVVEYFLLCLLVIVFCGCPCVLVLVRLPLYSLFVHLDFVTSCFIFEVVLLHLLFPCVFGVSTLPGGEVELEEIS